VVAMVSSSNGGMMVSGGEPKNSEQTCFHATLSGTNVTLSYPGVNNDNISSNAFNLLKRLTTAVK
jgi:hypothetical protein